MVDIYWSNIKEFLVVCEIQKKAVWLGDFDYKKYLSEDSNNNNTIGRYQWASHREFVFKWID